MIARLDAPTLPAVSRRFVEWVADYCMAPLGAVLRMTMSVSAALQPPRPVAAWRRTELPPADGRPVTPARGRVLAVLAGGPPRTTGELAREAGVGPGVVHGLAAQGLIEPVLLPPASPYRLPSSRTNGVTLSPAQADVAAALAARATAGGFSTTLIDGVTGAGKTEVYFEAVAATLAAGRQALVLLPEIALSAQWLDRFVARFGVRPAEWHSDLTTAERRVAWRAIAAGDARVVVGARSALFLPYPALGLIVVDEEHDAAYKQEDGVVYQARDMAPAAPRLGDTLAGDAAQRPSRPL